MLWPLQLNTFPMFSYRKRKIYSLSYFFCNSVILKVCCVMAANRFVERCARCARCALSPAIQRRLLFMSCSECHIAWRSSIQSPSDSQACESTDCFVYGFPYGRALRSKEQCYATNLFYALPMFLLINIFITRHIDVCVCSMLMRTLLRA